MEEFVGRFERQVDDKGRLALPSAFRPRFEPRCYLAPGDDGCIDVLTKEGFREVVNDLMEKVRRGEISKARQRVISGTTVDVTLDGQGRVLLTPELREFAGIDLKGSVIVAGSFDRVEIWNPEAYRRQFELGGAQIKGASH